MFRSPEPEQVLRELEPVLTLLRDALVEGAEQGARYSEEYGVGPIDPHVHAALTRQGASVYLRRGNLASLGFVQQEGVNASVHLLSPEFEIRCLKADGEKATPYPRTDARVDYFHQLSFGDADPSASQLLHRRVNLVVTWTVDANFQLAQLHLSCPQAVGTSRVENYWVRELRVRSDPVAISQPDAPQMDDLTVRPKVDSGDTAQDA